MTQPVEGEPPATDVHILIVGATRRTERAIGEPRPTEAALCHEIKNDADFVSDVGDGASQHISHQQPFW